MARKMRKFSDGGSDKYKAKYERKLKDIESDYAKASKGKTGKAAEIAAAKRDQRLADAKDDLAKWTKSDRTRTRAGEKAAERNLSMTRKYGAVKSATAKDVGETARVPSSGDVVKAPAISSQFMPKAKPKATAKPAPKPVATSTSQPSTRAQLELKRTAARSQKAIREQRAENQADFRKRVQNGMIKSDAGKTNSAGPRDNTAAGRRARMGAALSYLNPFSYLENKAKRLNPSEMAKGGTVKKKPMPKEGTTGGASTVPMTPERKKFMQRMQEEQAASKKGVAPNPTKYAKGGKMADKAGRALKKKSADTMGRAMMKKAGGGKCYAKGGSVSSRADGCAVKGKTKGKMV